MKRICIVILGMHRSGTSALTGVLSQMGLQAGSSLLGPNEFNAKGYFECRDIVAAHDLLLAELDRAWDDVRPLPQGWENSVAAVATRSKLVALFQSEFGNAQLCVLKDPRICRLLPLWLDVFDELDVVPRFLIAQRDPEEVAASLAKRDSFPVKKSHALYADYLLEAELRTRGLSRYVVNYTALLQNWRDVLAAFNATLQLKLPVPVIAVERDILAFLRPDLRHFHAGDAGSMEVRDEAMLIAQGVYAALDAIDNATLFDTLRVRLAQYVTAAEPWIGLAAQAGRLAYAAPTSNGRSGGAAQLYWRSGETNYHESNSILAGFTFSVERQTLRFTLPTEVSEVSGLRLDLSDCPAFCMVHALRIMTADGNPLWHGNDAGPLLMNPSGDMHILSGDGLQVFSLANDPYAQLGVPTLTLAALGPGAVLEIDTTMQAPEQGYQQLSDELGNRAQNIREQTVQLESITASAVALQAEIAAQNEVLRTLRQQSMQFVTQLSRAEAQLELLKDLSMRGELVSRL